MSTPSWSIESWCASQPESDWHDLPPSTQVFLGLLNLSATHPFCDPLTAPVPYALEGVPPQGPLLHYDHLETWHDVWATAIAMSLPPLAAMAELWLRLLASLIAPVGIAHLLYSEMKMQQQQSQSSSSNESNRTTKQQQQQPARNYSSYSPIICILTVAASAVLLTDTLYILEFGPRYGGALLAMAVLLSYNITCRRFPMPKTALAITGLLVLTAHLIYDGRTGTFSFGDARDHVVTVDEGLYYDPHNPLARRIAQPHHWSPASRTYSAATGATPWMPTGDSRTGLPFLLSKVGPPDWQRVWLPLADGEVVALDIAFPVRQQGHSTTQPIYLVLHGLNGGSKEQYVRDFAKRRIQEGSTVAVMVARGLMEYVMFVFEKDREKVTETKIYSSTIIFNSFDHCLSSFSCVSQFAGARHGTLPRGPLGRRTPSGASSPEGHRGGAAPRWSRYVPFLLARMLIACRSQQIGGVRSSCIHACISCIHTSNFISSLTCNRLSTAYCTV